MLDQLVRITLFGNLEVAQQTGVISRFPTQKTGELLACLAHNLRHSHTRAELIERLWPDSDPEAGRNRLRVTLSSLRRQLEPPGVPTGTVLIADRNTICLNAQAVQVDTALFEQAQTQAAQAGEEDGVIGALTTAVNLYAGDFLATYDAEWILSERMRLAASCLNALHRLARLLFENRSYHEAIDCARRILAADPYREEAHLLLMRLYVAVGQPSAALRQFQELETLLRTEMQAAPAPQLREFAAKLTRALGHGTSELRQATIPGATPMTPLSPALSSSPPSSLSSLSSSLPAALSSPASPAPVSPLHRLPVQFTRFFGRGDELARLAALIRPDALPNANAFSPFPSSSRIVTLTGPGGIGKTRLGLEVAAYLQLVFAGEVWFIPLAGVTEAQFLPEAIANTLALPRSAQISSLDQILAALAGRPVLLLLDNFEQLDEEAARIALQLLERLPALSLFVTSRRILGLPGEVEFSLDTLPLPESAPALEALMQNACVRLFVDRAQQVRPDFQLTPRNADAIAALCRDLEGLPLALELAAARCRMLTPAQMRQQLTSRLDMLASRGMEKNERHRSLRAAIEWSYRLLAPEQRAFFASLSVFRGGWSLDAITAIAGTECHQIISRHADSTASHPLPPREPLEILDRLEKLRQDSLIQTTDVNETIRFRMLETLREFADEQLTPADHAVLQRHHAAYFRALAVESGQALKGGRQIEQMQTLLAEQENLRAALEWCFADAPARDGLVAPNAPEEGLQIALALGIFWEIRGLQTEGRAWLERALRHSLRASDVAAALCLGGTLAMGQGDLAQAKSLLDESLLRARERGDAAPISQALQARGTLSLKQQEYDHANACLQEALALRQAGGDNWLVAQTLNGLGLVALRSKGDHAQAQRLFAEAHRLVMILGDRRTAAYYLHNLATIAREQQNYAEAIALSEAGIVESRAVGDVWQECYYQLNRGLLEELTGNEAQSAARYRECLRLAQQFGDKPMMASVLWNLADQALRAQASARYATLMGAAMRLYEVLAEPFSPEDWQELDAKNRAARQTLSPAAFEVHWNRGQSLTPTETVRFAFESVGIRH